VEREEIGEGLFGILLNMLGGDLASPGGEPSPGRGSGIDEWEKRKGVKKALKETHG